MSDLLNSQSNSNGMSLLGAAAIAGGAALISNITASVQSNKNLKKQMQYNHEEAQIARDWQEKMWNESNRYSHPAQQMQRLSESGLNPNLVYNNGADTTAASVPSASSGANAGNLQQREYFRAGEGIAQGLRTYLDMQQLESQINLNDSIARLNNQKADESAATTEGITIDNENKRACQSYMQQSAYWDVVLKQDNHQVLENSVLEISSRIAKNSAEVNKISADILETIANTAVLQEESHLKHEQTFTEKARQQLLKAQTSEAFANAWYKYQEAAIQWRQLQLDIHKQRFNEYTWFKEYGLDKQRFGWQQLTDWQKANLASTTLRYQMQMSSLGLGIEYMKLELDKQESFRRWIKLPFESFRDLGIGASGVTGSFKNISSMGGSMAPIGFVK